MKLKIYLYYIKNKFKLKNLLYSNYPYFKRNSLNPTSECKDYTLNLEKKGEYKVTFRGTGTALICFAKHLKTPTGLLKARTKTRIATEFVI